MTIRSTMAVLLALMLLGPDLQAQQRPDLTGRAVLMSRDALLSARERLEQLVGSPAYSSALRDGARFEISLIDTRLREGDFQVGDRILLNVEGEQQLSDSFTVERGPSLRLPLAGEIALKGVLRSELEDHLENELRRFIREPVVRVQSLIRMSVLGAVARQGFYSVPSELVISDALMVAGGPAQNANLPAMRIERLERTIWSGEPLQQAITEGRTLDQLSLQAGDRIVVPARRESMALAVVGAIGGLASFAFVMSRVLRLF